EDNSDSRIAAVPSSTNAVAFSSLMVPAFISIAFSSCGWLAVEERTVKGWDELRAYHPVRPVGGMGSSTHSPNLTTKTRRTRRRTRRMRSMVVRIGRVMLVFRSQKINDSWPTTMAISSEPFFKIPFDSALAFLRVPSCLGGEI